MLPLVKLGLQTFVVIKPLFDFIRGYDGVMRGYPVEKHGKKNPGL